MSEEQKAIFTKATINALHHLAGASDAVLGVDMARYPHMRKAAQAINEAVSIIDDSRDVQPVEMPVTVIINSDVREWDDPYIAIIDAIGCETPEDLRGLIVQHYYDQFCPDEFSGDTTPETYFNDEGCVIQAVTPGAVQMGWQRGGVDNELLAEILGAQPHE